MNFDREPSIGDLVMVTDRYWDTVCEEHAVVGTVISKNDSSWPVKLEVLVRGNLWQVYSDGVVVLSHT